ncbi:MAG: rhamnogalacturonan acetylesterase [Phycisphaerales bacterium]|nr:rhamnogalacturonan acetylesterase [Phycisphaerales bacterium]
MLNKMSFWRCGGAALSLFIATAVAGAAENKQLASGGGASSKLAGKPIDLKFYFGKTTSEPGFTPIAADAGYDAKRGYGFEPDQTIKLQSRSTGPALGREFATADAPILFSAKAPEGNYHVTAWLGDPEGETETQVKAESRRIMYPLVRTKKGELTKIDFTVNVRTAWIDNKNWVKISDREKTPSVRHWDDKLTLEFAGKRPAVAAIEIQKVDDAVTVFLAGDSTVTDQPQEPWTAWGQLIPQFFKPNIAIANNAESGRSLKSFKADRRWEKVLSQLKAGDYVFIQFGHNDMKEAGGKVAYTTFSDSLRQYIQEAKTKDAHVVVLTPMHRRTFAGNEIRPSFGDYPDAIRKVAWSEGVPLIDLQAMTKPMYEAFGPEKAKAMFVYAPAGTYPGQDKAFKDDTHFQAFGSDQIARCVLQGIRDLKLPLADSIRDGVPTFDPSHPDDPTKYYLPSSVAVQTVTPEGK